MNQFENDDNWVRLELPFEHKDGQFTRMIVQTDGKSFVLSEHPENKGPCVWHAAEKVGNSLLITRIEDEPKFKPEDLQLYVEREDKRFDKWTARTTMTENTSTDSNRIEPKATEWLWKTEQPLEHSAIESKLNTQITVGQLSESRGHSAYIAQQMSESSLTSTGESEQLRQGVAEMQRQHPKHEI